MKPTQQEIIDLAYEDGGHTYPEWLRFVPIFALERLVHLALERFGAGGGEPARGVVIRDGLPTLLSDRDIKTSDTRLYTHPSPTDLRDEYLRGLEDAAKVCEYVATLYSEAARKHPEDSESRSRTFARSRAASQCVEEIRALLKGKQ